MMSLFLLQFTGQGQMDISLALINQLPTELLIELFSTCFDNDPVYLPLSLASVCHLWREIILTSPRLWQFISIDYHQGHRSMSSIISQAHIWLSRSAPLHFDVEFKLNPNSQDSLLPLMSPFLPSIDRWRHCWICGSEREESINIPDLFQPGLNPVLHYLNLTVQPNEESTTDSSNPPTLYSCGANSQKPQHISMNISIATLPLSDDLAKLQFTALNITEVSLDVYLLPSQILQFLLACPLLEQLFFSGGFHTEEGEDDSLPLPTVHLVHLRTLLVRNTCFQRTILSHLHTPCLRELHLQNLNLDFELQHFHAMEDGDSEEEFPDYSQSPSSDHHTGMGLRKLITRSNPPLEVLDMDLSDMRAKDFRWCFDRLSTLRRFRITGSDMSDKVIDLFKPIMPSLPIETGGDITPRPPPAVKLRLPHLLKLKLYNCQRLTGKAVIDALSNRVRYTDGLKAGTETTTLQRVAIVDCIGFGVEDAQKLSEVLGDRLRVI